MNSFYVKFYIKRVTFNLSFRLQNVKTTFQYSDSLLSPVYNYTPAMRILILLIINLSPIGIKNLNGNEQIV